MPSPSPLARRAGPDACPGVLSVWNAGDGGLARVRLPGGVLSAAGLRVLAAAAEELGTGALELTLRGNVQVRGLAPGAEVELAARLRLAGMLPSDSHERVRNIVASPLTGLVSERPDVLPVVAALDAGLLADPALAALPGRFLFAVDDGALDVAGLAADVTLVAAGDGFALHLGGVPLGRVSNAAAALAAARAFLAERDAQQSPAWRLIELDDGPARVAIRLDSLLMQEPVIENRPDSASESSTGSCMSAATRPGEHRQRDGRVALVVEVPDGKFDAAAARELADRSTGELRVTPWRSVVLPNLEAEEQ